MRQVYKSMGGKYHLGLLCEICVWGGGRHVCFGPNGSYANDRDTQME